MTQLEFAELFIEIFIEDPAREIVREIALAVNRTPESRWQQEVVAFALAGFVQACRIRHQSCLGFSEAVFSASAHVVSRLGGMSQADATTWLAERLCAYAMAGPLSEQQHSALCRVALSNVVREACAEPCSLLLLGSFHAAAIRLVTSGMVLELYQAYRELGRDNWLLAVRNKGP